jgi:hypothetical protein
MGLGRQVLPPIALTATGGDATLVTLTIAEGAGEHTHAGALGRAHQIMFDWLDITLAR